MSAMLSQPCDVIPQRERLSASHELEGESLELQE
jgi:hypothetical protein